MKKFGILIIITGILITLSTSCEEMFGDFLDKGPGVDVTEDTIFSSVTQMESFLAATYESGMYTAHSGHAPHPYGTTNGGNMYANNINHFTNSTDEGNSTEGWYYSHTIWNPGNLTVANANINDLQWPVRWQAIRQIYIMMAKVGTVPGIDPVYANQVVGEMKYLLAQTYFEMFRRYGGVPIVTKAFGATEDIDIPRSTLQETVDFIITNCDEAYAALPYEWPTNWKGRATKLAALALKAKTLLYVASPLFNTATPVLSMANPADNNLIVMGDYKLSRWLDAANAAKQVLDEAPLGNVQLVTNQGVDKNYKYVWEVNDNSEIIIAAKGSINRGKTNNNAPWMNYFGRGMNGWNGTNVNQGFIERFYEKADGTPQTWGASGTNLNAKYAEMEPRFKQSILYNGVHYGNTNYGIIELFTGPPNGKHIQGNQSGYWMKKFCPDVQYGQGYRPGVIISWPVARLAEFYLSYAEALNEYNAAPPQAVYDAVNEIRNRSGLPDLPTGLTQEEMRQRIIKEWAVEFFHEEKRYWDIKRWLIGEEIVTVNGTPQGTFNGPVMYGLVIRKMTGTTPQDYSYTRYKIEDRVFHKRMYLDPFRLSEVNKGYIVQNPGY
jgi:hypothetical protein